MSLRALLSPAVRRALFWGALLVLLLIRPGGVPVTRTQEARVLETARQMLGSAAPDRYLVPRLNGALRLEKPPLNYWLAGSGFHAFGTSAAAGRLPTILAGWGTLLLTGLAGAWFLNRRTGLHAAACLLSSYLFYRHTRLAETDALATFFVTAACLCFWRGSAPEVQGSGEAGSDCPLPDVGRPDHRGAYLLYHLGAVMAAGAALAKGPPALFPVLFLVLYHATNPPFRRVAGFLRSGAWVTLVVLSGAWYAYLAGRGLLATAIDEVDVIAAGRNHGGNPFAYFGYLLTATAPWSALFVAGLTLGVRRFRSDPALRALVCWFAAVLLPLCVIGNRQAHYLLPLLPPSALLTAALLDRVSGLAGGGRPGTGRQGREVGIVSFLFLATVVTAGLAGLALPVVSHVLAGRAGAGDILLAAAVVAASAATLVLHRGRGLPGSVPAFVAAAAVLVPVTLACWMPRVLVDDYSTFAAALAARFGPDARYAVYRQEPRLPLNFALRRASPTIPTPEVLAAALREDPGTVVLVAARPGAAAPPVPPGLTPVLTVAGRERDLYAYTRPASPATVPVAAP